ncbi:MAG: Nicotinate dehydrogenase subunit [Pseudomonadota bacterium]|jgi:isoquinoline 1-oxidoreductase beta subunit
MKRRAFLQTAGAGLTVVFAPGCALPVVPKRPAPQAQDALAWIRFDGGRYTLHVPRVEMGQNIATAFKQIACEELGIAWDRLDVRLHNTESIGRVRATVGSESVKDFAVPLAQACATLREALAAGRTQGVIKARVWRNEELALFKRGRSFVGSRMPLEQGAQIVTGQALYAADVRRPGMLYGRVLRAAASPELVSKVSSMNEAAARAVPGFIALVRDDLLKQMNAQGIGIVARTPGALERIEAALNLQWQVEGGFEQGDIDRAIDIDARLANAGSLAKQIHRDEVRKEGKWDVDLRIDIPLAAHAPIEPRCAVAEVNNENKLQLWVGTQDVFYQRDVMVKRLGFHESDVIVYGQRVGGAFGGKTICTVELEAAVLAKAVRAPVKVQWTRAQEFRQAFHRPPSSHRLRARLRDGKLDEWWHVFSSSHILFTNAVLPPWIQRLTNFIGDDGVARGASLAYRARSKRTEFDLVRLPVLTGPWRGLGAGPNVFAIESAIDECARVAKADPVQFRLAHIEDLRLARTLRAVAAAAGWAASKPAASPGALRGRGVACGIYKAMSYAAVVADVEVTPTTGDVNVLKLWCAHDCGMVVNPDQVRAQCEGNLVWGLGMVLTDKLPVAASQVAASTFADAPIPRMADVPPMEIILVDEGEAPTGAGETAIVAAAAAVANAIRDASGIRPTRLPILPQDMQTSQR